MDSKKQAVLAARETDTVFLNQQSRPALRALRTARTAALEPLCRFDVMENMAGVADLYFGGDMEAAIPLSGQVCGRIDEVLGARQIIEDTMSGFQRVIAGLAQQYAPQTTAV